MKPAERAQILRRYRAYACEFDRIARTSGRKRTTIRLQAAVNQIGRLSPRELQVLALTADGYTNAEIAQQLDVTEETVKSHVRHLLAKLQARSRAHAITVGFRRGLLS